MAAVIIRDRAIHIPGSVRDLESFRGWVQSTDLPPSVRIDFLDGEIWVDDSMEDLFTHNKVKGEFCHVLIGLVKRARAGTYFADGVRLSNLDAELSVEPDGCFVSTKGLREHVRAIEGARGGHVELEGSPDMVLEIISDSSVQKDRKHLKRKYWEAGIREYWLVDVRGERLEFEIFRHGNSGYVAIRKKEGWVRSTVFETSFRLLREFDDLEYPEYTLESREHRPL